MRLKKIIKRCVKKHMKWKRENEVGKDYEEGMEREWKGGRE